MKEEIIKILSQKDLPSQTIIEINDKLKLKSLQDFQALETTLKQMVQEGTLYYSDRKRKYMIYENSHLMKGKLNLNNKGFGFVTVEGIEKDIYINQNNINGATNDDIVCVEFINKELHEGRIIKIIKRDDSILTGEFYKKKNHAYVKLNHSSTVLEIPKKKTAGAVEGHKVIIEKLGNNQAQVTKIIGHKNDVGADILPFVYEHNFEPDFPKEVMNALNKIPEEVSAKERDGRLDLRAKTIFTIDGDDTKDIDDAISIQKFPDGTYELGVHIADVSHYVKKGSVIDQEAYKRGTSVYLVDRVIPMLPHKLSNGICSLNPEVDRLALSCLMHVDQKGKVIDYSIAQTIIKSQKQMTYNNVNKILEENIIPKGYENFVSDLNLMKELSDILRDKMIKRGYIEFGSKEAKIIVDEKCHPIDIKLRNQGVGESMIENFMVLANETVASHIFYRDLPGIYRVHDKPAPEKINSIFDFLSLRGLIVKGKRNENITSKDLQKILEQLKDKPGSQVLTELMIRTQAKAVYSEDNIGHFGLGSQCYSHFTSPIRRYPDLTLHRLVKDYDHEYSQLTIDSWERQLPEIAIHCSDKEQDSVECERDVEKMKKAEYMEDKIGQTFPGVISGVQKFGIFVALDNTVEGLIKLEDLKGDNYIYDEKSIALIGKNTKKTYRFGDPIQVKVARASKETMMIDFEVVEEQKNVKKKEKKIQPKKNNH